MIGYSGGSPVFIFRSPLCPLMQDAPRVSPPREGTQACPPDWVRADDKSAVGFSFSSPTKGRNPEVKPVDLSVLKVDRVCLRF